MTRPAPLPEGIVDRSEAHFELLYGNGDADSDTWEVIARVGGTDDSPIVEIAPVSDDVRRSATRKIAAALSPDSEGTTAYSRDSAGGAANVLLARMLEKELGGKATARNTSITLTGAAAKSEAAVRAVVAAWHAAGRPTAADAMEHAAGAARHRSRNSSRAYRPSCTRNCSRRSCWITSRRGRPWNRTPRRADTRG